MPESKEKKQFSKQEKAQLLESFGLPLNNQSLRIIEHFMDSGKDMNKVLLKAYKFRKAC